MPETRPIQPGDVVQLHRSWPRYGDCFAVVREIAITSGPGGDHFMIHASVPIPWTGGMRWVDVGGSLADVRFVGAAPFNPHSVPRDESLDWIGGEGEGRDPEAEIGDDTWRPMPEED